MVVLRHQPDALPTHAHPIDALSYSWNRDLARPAPVAVDLRALTEPAQILGQADTDLLKDPPSAGNRNHVGPQARIGIDEGPLDLARQHLRPAVQAVETVRDAHEFPRLPDRAEIAARAFPRAGPVLAPLIARQVIVREEPLGVGQGRLRDEAAAGLAEARVALLPLRPQAVGHEAEAAAGVAL